MIIDYLITIAIDHFDNIHHILSLIIIIDYYITSINNHYFEICTLFITVNFKHI